MYKVIVERPRRGGNGSRVRALPRDLEDSPSHEGMRLRHTDHKNLNENLRPLERYLQRQVGRPWNKVFSEICASIDRRNTVQQHIHQHIDNFVDVQVVEVDGVLHTNHRWGGLCRLEDAWTPLYVDPVSGLLRENKARAKAAWLRREERQRTAQAAAEHRRDLPNLRQLHRVEGIWYEVSLATIRSTGSFDLLLHKLVVPHGSITHPKNAAMIGGDARLYGRANVYAHSKRQLNARELRAHGVENTAE
jgi:hypothetical protein